MYSDIKIFSHELVKKFDQIPQDRKEILAKISSYIAHKKNENRPVNLVYICTHNSRRSHFGQIWAKVAADYFNISNVHTFSGGTEATAFNENAINALKHLGFKIEQTTDSKNPVYHVFHSETTDPTICFSKVFDHKINPTSAFAAIMTCADAEENCPFIPNAELRIATTYNDPKEFDNTPLRDAKYSERCEQIALESFYVFSKINNY